MFETERLEKIQEILAENGALSVQRLARALFVSESTVRRDLSELQRQGLVKRIHGGAVLITGASRELPLYMRERDHPDAKERIAEQAVSYIRDGQALFLDASSTVQKMVGRLAAFRDLTIITNGLKTAQELSQLPHTIYCTGGLLLHSSHAYVGHGAERAVREYNADLFFFSSRGISADGRITDTSGEETQLRRAMFEQSKGRIFLCDSSKFGQLYCYNLCTVRQVDAMVSDRGFAVEEGPKNMAPGTLG